jgi:hypothetical protein
MALPSEDSRVEVDRKVQAHYPASGGAPLTYRDRGPALLQLPAMSPA